MIGIIGAAIASWLLGVWGWAQIIGSIQNLGERGGLLFTLILWVCIMGGGAYLANSMGYIVPCLVGYAISFFMVKASGRIE